MKTLMMAMAMIMVVSFGMPNNVNAQSKQKTNVGQMVSGLVNVNVGAVSANIGDITLEDIVDVNNVLNSNNVRALNNVLNNSPVASKNSQILTNTLRDAKLLTGTQVVVGVLDGGKYVVQNATAQ